MITVIYSTNKTTEVNKEFIKHLQNSSGIPNLEIYYEYNLNQYSLATIYNKYIDKATNDIVVCCHDDIKLSKDWGLKLLNDYNTNDYSIIGKAGSAYFPKSGVYWEHKDKTMVGHVYHKPKDGKKYLSKYSNKTKSIVPVITIDGLFISFNKTKIKHKFDESIGMFHFYDHLFCLPNYISGVKIGVTFSFDITHESIGLVGDDFNNTRLKFLDKWGDKLPLDLKPTQINFNQIIREPLNKLGKVAIIIPTKGKIELLESCINSFLKHCDSNVFDILIADTGSEPEEIDKIKTYISDKQNIKLIQYDYYNFSKINNDVVINHVKDNYEFVLFCNNDIEILNDVVYGMLKTFKNNKKAGAVGARLHFKDNTIQHGGIVMFVDNKKRLSVTHHNLKSYYNYMVGENVVIGCTGALLMMRVSTFKQCGMFNEAYVSCFEDVELNLKINLIGYDVIYNGDLVAYHYESATRNDDPENLTKLNSDYANTLLPFINKNLGKLKNKIYFEK